MLEPKTKLRRYWLPDIIKPPLLETVKDQTLVHSRILLIKSFDVSLTLFHTCTKLKLAHTVERKKLSGGKKAIHAALIWRSKSMLFKIQI